MVIARSPNFKKSFLHRPLNGRCVVAASRDREQLGFCCSSQRLFAFASDIRPDTFCQCSLDIRILTALKLIESISILDCFTGKVHVRANLDSRSLSLSTITFLFFSFSFLKIKIIQVQLQGLILKSMNCIWTLPRSLRQSLVVGLMANTRYHSRVKLLSHLLLG